MTLEELALFNELLSSRFGLYFPEHKREILESRLAPRVRANHLQRFLDYYLLLHVDIHQELDPLIRAVTNNESYFFRETSQFEALFEAAFEQLRASGSLAGKLRVLSAGCSSGEEPYTLNILARSTVLAPDSMQIDAVDIDSERLEMARAATYRPTSLRILSDEQTRRYFHQLDTETYELRLPFRQGVSFRPGNILDLGSLRKPFPYDVLFCRNVLIYFSEAALKTAIHNFAELLRPGGLLFLGHSESIIGLTQAFQAERLGSCIAYRRV
ncbi:MAG: protein-glutamate O-methyltransferase CheR [Thermoanaerobaculia bacterium]|nr:protein-glutamate O-methyltransferase CheR [Thermoanaerobaculia bacterium]